nr:MAG TPA: hypothetical protein [Caudoviricetes sp.]DAM85944.1 MAG TPA: hypothetical protein [Caudoviricetes sp.]DAT31818.1 MAG TPA: hypothetical protein [Caudoviricetes sp.]DAZ64779.1 MAG TPA: hypothetical protein [Caudoviricetes sp.]
MSHWSLGHHLPKKRYYREKRRRSYGQGAGSLQIRP